MGVGHQRISIAHNRHNDTGPFGLIVFLHANFALFLLMFEQFFAQWVPACRTYKAINDELWDRIWREGVILFAKLYNFSHGLWVPVCEGSTDHRGCIERGHEVIIGLDLGILVLEVLSHFLITNMGQLTDSR